MLGRTVAAGAAVLRRQGAGCRSIASLPRFDFRALQEREGEMQLNIARRNAVGGDPRRVLELYAQYNAARNRWDELQQRRAQSGSEMAQAKDPARKEELREAGRLLKAAQSEVTAQTTDLVAQLAAEAHRLPNWTHPSVPQAGEPPRILAVHGNKGREAKTADHLDIGARLGLVDFANGARVSGSRFCFLKGDGALLELALVNYSVAKAAERGFVPILTPDLVHSTVAEGTGYQPRGDASQIFTVEGKEDGTPGLCLIATSEIPLAGMYMDTILTEAQLPVKMVGISHCFRREVGSHGQESRGLYRVHQFTKVELFMITRPEDSEAAFDEIVSLQRSIFDDLGLHYHVLDMPVDDLGAAAHRKVDIEAWMPSRGNFGEISSASDCTDYQSRRLNIRYRPTGSAAAERGASTRFVHTLNGTACAVPRAIIALLENNVTDDGNAVVLPECLRPFMGGRTHITASQAAARV